MKKLLSILLVAMLSLTLVSCNKTNDGVNKDNLTVYVNQSQEEYDGTMYEFETYVILKDDNKGYMIMQDIVPVKWDDITLYNYNNDIAYPYTLDGNTLTLDYFGEEVEYTLDESKESLNEGVLKMIAECDERDALGNE